VDQNVTKSLMLTGLCLAFSSAHATSLSPGQTVNSVPVYSYGTPAFPTGYPENQNPAHPTGAGQLGANPLLQEGASWSPAGSGTPSANITFENAVYVDPVTGDLDFFYQIQNSYSGAATLNNTVSPTITIDDFSLPGVAITGVAQITAADYQHFEDFLQPAPAGVTVSSIALAASDQTLTINYSNPIAPAQNSAILVLETNAKQFNQNAEGTFNWAGATPLGAHGSGAGTGSPATTFTLDALEPVLSPEPGVYGALSLCLAGLLLLVHRRSSGKTEKSRSDDATVL
jgi:hypothetical protein